MDSTSDSENEEILELCKQLKIKAPLKKPKLRNIPLSELENIDINNLPVQILPDILPECNEGTALVINQEILQNPVISAAETEAIAQHNIEEPSQESVPISCEELQQDLVLQDSAPHLDESRFQEIDPSFEEQPSVSTTTTNPPSQLEIQPSDDEYGDLNTNRKRSIKGFGNSNKWDKSRVKIKRMKGEEYVGYRRDRKVQGNEKFKVLHDIPRPAREMAPRCTSIFCTKSKIRGCPNLTDDERQDIFSKFWKNMTWDQRKQYVVSNVLICERKQIKKTIDSRRSESKQYFLPTSIGRIQVCMQTFLKTLGLKESTVRCWLNNSEHGIAKTSNDVSERGVIRKDDIAFLKQFFALLPKMPSHYCRANTSKLYLEPIIEDKTMLYKLYAAECEKAEKSALSRWTFDRIFDELNLSLFVVKKDQCDTCCSHKVGNITDDRYYIAHIQAKEMARNEKAKDKERAQQFGDVHVFTHDLQAVKLCPQLQASALYYKTKLCVHNFTMYNLATKDVYCYWFDETNAGLTASVFISCIIHILRKTLEHKCIPIILYSDGCTAQNRNVFLANALLQLAIEKNVVIVQKILEKGHTQMECDAVHSSIEQKTKNKEIFLPSQYASISKEARPKQPYTVEYLSYDFFDDYSKKNTFMLKKFVYCGTPYA
ncbi:uncharacterized protein LOC110999393 isoform X1 [Pieris rapae]|uniref:uncharacterized protein LOC110999393 isoform X1 n=1 Tax=Pieris rapae TaxID=64459 RepID=UPI001E27D61A|nr:uncharacterized protein LOC110999393 isoform X1 [Pieris rapae]